MLAGASFAGAGNAGTCMESSPHSCMISASQLERVTRPRHVRLTQRHAQRTQTIRALRATELAGRDARAQPLADHLAHELGGGVLLAKLRQLVEVAIVE